MSLLRIEDLVVDYEVQEGILRSVDHAFLDVNEGEFMGLIGESGCGKTTIVQAIFNVLPSNGYIRQGRILFEGIDILSLTPEEQRKIRWEKIAAVFQAAQSSLNPVLRIRDQFIDVALDHGHTSGDEIMDRVKNLLNMVGLEPDRVLNAYPHELSGGMKQRVVIAMSLLLNPKLLVLDEPTTALDLITQAHLMDMLRNLHEKLGITMLMVTHDVSNIARVADRVAVMYAAKIVEVGDVETIFYNPCHPYTIGLIKAIPSIVDDPSSKKPIPGTPPSLINPPSGCRFHPRCAYANEQCIEEVPELVVVEPGHMVACHRWLEVLRVQREVI